MRLVEVEQGPQIPHRWSQETTGLPGPLGLLREAAKYNVIVTYYVQLNKDNTLQG